jgi:hypothetical protein
MIFRFKFLFWAPVHPMKTTHSILLFSLLLSTAISCKKEDLNDSIIGKWTIYEQYNGYLNGGDFKWHEVPGTNKWSIEFDASGNCIEIKSGTFTPCSGSYSLVSNQQLIINSGCNAVPQNLNISIRKDQLLITRQVREGEIIEKYLREK